MGKHFKHIIFLLLAAVLVIVSCDKKPIISTYVSLEANDKNPYGTFVFHQSLPKFFPSATIKNIYQTNGLMSLLSDNKQQNLFISISNNFFPGIPVVDSLVKFVESGNTVFISAMDISNVFLDSITGEINKSDYILFGDTDDDSTQMNIFLKRPPFEKRSFTYPGVNDHTNFSLKYNNKLLQLATNDNKHPVFVQFKKGKGNIFIHVAPLSFTNYFLLYSENYRYLESVVSYIAANKNFKNIIVNHSSLYYDEGDEQPKSNASTWLTKFIETPGIGTGLILALVLIILYFLIHLQRRNKIIPNYSLPKNESAEFIKTVGLLYYDKKDHNNLAQKISIYFLEHIRSRYKIFATKPDSQFVKELSGKSKVDELLVSNIVKYINLLNAGTIFSDENLVLFRNQIEEFYNQEKIKNGIITF